jgi:hypothetical protein
LKNLRIGRARNALDMRDSSLKLEGGGFLSKNAEGGVSDDDYVSVACIQDLAVLETIVEETTNRVKTRDSLQASGGIRIVKQFNNLVDLEKDETAVQSVGPDSDKIIAVVDVHDQPEFALLVIGEVAHLVAIVVERSHDSGGFFVGGVRESRGEK